MINEKCAVWALNQRSFFMKFADCVKNLRIVQKLLEKILIIAMFGTGIATDEK